MTEDDRLRLIDWVPRRIQVWWHVWHLGHSVRVNRTISVPAFDPGSMGWLYECECGESWAR